MAEPTEFPTGDEFAGGFTPDVPLAEDEFAAPSDSGFDAGSTDEFTAPAVGGNEFDSHADDGFATRADSAGFDQPAYPAAGFPADDFSGTAGVSDGSFDPYAGMPASGGEDEVKLDTDSGSDSKLAEFNAKFREECETKDRDEQAAVEQRKAAAHDALRAHFDEKSRNLMTRKEHNRALEREKEADMEAALQGESWARVGGLVDLSVAESGTEDVSRLKTVLISLKSKPLPPAAAM